MVGLVNSLRPLRTSALRKRLVKQRADLAEALGLADSRELPQSVLHSIYTAHHALTEAIARLHQIETSYHADEDTYA